MQNKRNRILIICPSMWPEMNSWGGGTQRMYYLANYLALHGWEVYTVSPGFKNNGKTSLRDKKYISYFWGTYNDEIISRKEQEKNIYSMQIKW